MTNPFCECPAAGFCSRHQMQKNQTLHNACKGELGTSDCGRKYWDAWETGRAGATAPSDPQISPEGFCDKVKGMSAAQCSGCNRGKTREKPSARGFGDLISSALATVGITEERVSAWVGGECGCAARKDKLNRLGAWAASFIAGSPTEQIEAMIQEEQE